MPSNKAKPPFLKLFRSYFEHELWEEDRELSKAEAWLWMLKEARYSNQEGKRWVNGRLVTWNKGQILGAIRYLKRAWNWNSTGKVYRFLEYLKDETMIEVSTEQGVNIITLCEHPTYNEHLYDAGTQNGTGSKTGDGSDNKKKKAAKKKSKSKKSSRFKKPTVDQVAEYFEEQKDIPEEVAGQIAQNFWEFYEMKGWKVGKDKMKNWKIAASRSLNWDDHKQLLNGHASGEHPKQRGYVEEEKARAHAEENRLAFKESIYPSIEHKGEKYYKLPE